MGLVVARSHLQNPCTGRALDGCFYEFGFFWGGSLITTALLFGVCVEAPVFWRLLYGGTSYGRYMGLEGVATS